MSFWCKVTLEIYYHVEQNSSSTTAAADLGRATGNWVKIIMGKNVAHAK